MKNNLKGKNFNANLHKKVIVILTGTCTTSKLNEYYFVGLRSRNRC